MILRKPIQSLASYRVPCICLHAVQTRIAPPFAHRLTRPSRRTLSSSVSPLARLTDLKYDIRRWGSRLRRFRRERDWESLVIGLLGANILIWLAWKPAKALRIAEQQWLDDFLRDNILLSWQSLTSGRIWTLLTCSLANHSGLHLFLNCVVLIPSLPLVLDKTTLRPILAIYFVAGALSSIITATWAHFYEREHGKHSLLTTTLEQDPDTGQYVERYGPVGAAKSERLQVWSSVPGRSVAYAEGGTAGTYGIVSFLLAAYAPRYAAGKLIPGYYLGAPFRIAFAGAILLDLFLARKRMDTSVAATAQLSGVVTGLGAFVVLRRARMLN